MRLLGRDVSSYTRALRDGDKWIVYVLRTFLLFKKPALFLYHYVTRTPLKTSRVEMRDGSVITLSPGCNDIGTVFGIFCRREYGDAPSGGIVVDVGANIGIFSLYAAKGKARKVYAFEPSAEAFAVLENNLAQNHFLNVVVPTRAFVAGSSDRVVKFPRKSSGFNAEIQVDTDEPFEAIATLSLDDFVKEHDVDRIDLMKIDCEGGEYEIIFNASDHLWKITKEIKLEYHQNRFDEIEHHLARHGFSVAHHVRSRSMLGLAWFKK